MTLAFENNWFPDSCLVFPKIYTFDVQSQEMNFYDLYIEGTNPIDNIPMLPWDLNEDGIFDSTYSTGSPKFVTGWPFYSDDLSVYYDNYYHIVKNEAEGWLAAVWSDGLKARKAYLETPGFEQWENTPEIAICISNDNGQSWSQPIFLNANETPELVDMIPEYVYPGDKIENLGNNHGKLHLMFLDDNVYGCNMGSITPVGGTITYCALDIDFSYETEVEDNIISMSSITLSNFPNPFNPSTEIRFQISDFSEAESTELSIYNLKGQRIRQFSISNNQSSITWNSKDQSGKSVSSGIYFCNLLVDGKILKSKKMMLIK